MGTFCFQLSSYVVVFFFFPLRLQLERELFLFDICNQIGYVGSLVPFSDFCDVVTYSERKVISNS